MYGTHEGKVAWSEPTHEAFFGQLPQRLEWKDGVEVGAFVGTIVGVGPREFFGVGRDLTVRAVAFEVVYIEALLIREVHATGRDEREAGPGDWLSGPDERRHAAQTLKRMSTVSPSFIR